MQRNQSRDLTIISDSHCALSYLQDDKISNEGNDHPKHISRN